MADRILFIGWGAPVRGREERGLEVFDEAVGFYGHCQQDDRIEAFNVNLLEPHGGSLKSIRRRLRGSRRSARRRTYVHATRE